MASSFKEEIPSFPSVWLRHESQWQPKKDPVKHRKDPLLESSRSPTAGAHAKDANPQTIRALMRLGFVEQDVKVIRNHLFGLSPVAAKSDDYFRALLSLARKEKSEEALTIIDRIDSLLVESEDNLSKPVVIERPPLDEYADEQDEADLWYIDDDGQQKLIPFSKTSEEAMDVVSKILHRQQQNIKQRSRIFGQIQSWIQRCQEDDIFVMDEDEALKELQELEQKTGKQVMSASAANGALQEAAFRQDVLSFDHVKERRKLMANVRSSIEKLVYLHEALTAQQQVLGSPMVLSKEIRRLNEEKEALQEKLRISSTKLNDLEENFYDSKKLVEQKNRLLEAMRDKLADEKKKAIRLAASLTQARESKHSSAITAAVLQQHQNDAQNLEKMLESELAKKRINELEAELNTLKETELERVTKYEQTIEDLKREASRWQVETEAISASAQFKSNQASKLVLNLMNKIKHKEMIVEALNQQNMSLQETGIELASRCHSAEYQQYKLSLTIDSLQTELKERDELERERWNSQLEENAQARIALMEAERAKQEMEQEVNDIRAILAVERPHIVTIEVECQVTEAELEQQIQHVIIDSPATFMDMDTQTDLDVDVVCEQKDVITAGDSMISVQTEGDDEDDEDDEEVREAHEEEEKQVQNTESQTDLHMNSSLFTLPVVYAELEDKYEAMEQEHQKIVDQLQSEMEELKCQLKLLQQQRREEQEQEKEQEKEPEEIKPVDMESHASSQNQSQVIIPLESELELELKAKISELEAESANLQQKLKQQAEIMDMMKLNERMLKDHMNQNMRLIVPTAEMIVQTEAIPSKEKSTQASGPPAPPVFVFKGSENQDPEQQQQQQQQKQQQQQQGKQKQQQQQEESQMVRNLRSNLLSMQSLLLRLLQLTSSIRPDGSLVPLPSSLKPKKKTKSSKKTVIQGPDNGEQHEILHSQQQQQHQTKPKSQKKHDGDEEMPELKVNKAPLFGSFLDVKPKIDLNAEQKKNAEDEDDLFGSDAEDDEEGEADHSRSSFSLLSKLTKITTGQSESIPFEEMMSTDMDALGWIVDQVRLLTDSLYEASKRPKSPPSWLMDAIRGWMNAQGLQKKQHQHQSLEEGQEAAAGASRSPQPNEGEAEGDEIRSVSSSSSSSSSSHVIPSHTNDSTTEVMKGALIAVTEHLQHAQSKLQLQEEKIHSLLEKVTDLQAEARRIKRVHLSRSHSQRNIPSHFLRQSSLIRANEGVLTRGRGSLLYSNSSKEFFPIVSGFRIRARSSMGGNRNRHRRLRSRVRKLRIGSRSRSRGRSRSRSSRTPSRSPTRSNPIVGEVSASEFEQFLQVPKSHVPIIPVAAPSAAADKVVFSSLEIQIPVVSSAAPKATHPGLPPPPPLASVHQSPMQPSSSSSPTFSVKGFSPIQHHQLSPQGRNSPKIRPLPLSPDQRARALHPLSSESPLVPSSGSPTAHGRLAPLSSLSSSPPLPLPMHALHSGDPHSARGIGPWLGVQSQTISTTPPGLESRSNGSTSPSGVSIFNASSMSPAPRGSMTVLASSLNANKPRANPSRAIQ